MDYLEKHVTCRRWLWIGLAIGFLMGLGVGSAHGMCAEHWAGMTTVSRHFTRDHRRYNESNWGPYVKCQLDQTWGAQGGWYPNSYDKDSWYIFATYTPWRTGDIKWGLVGGLASGYVENESNFFRKQILLGGGYVLWQYWPNVRFGLLINHAVGAITTEVRF